MEFELVIGLEVHAELQTRSKMFCACPVVDSTRAEANSAVCPVCSGMPGVLPVINRRAVEFALRVALALECTIQPVSIFARKNYFYPDLPKGYQISQYEQPLAINGRLEFQTSQAKQVVRIRRVHLEEDAGKLTHMEKAEDACSLIDLNRAGIPLLEIVTEPDLRSAEDVRAFAMALHSLLRYLGVNSGDMQKGVMRVEPNISVRLAGSPQFGTRTEIKNLNSFRALERSVAYEFQRQSDLLGQGLPVRQETRGWDESQGITFTQRVKEEADDYRYFPEPDLPPLMLEIEWVEAIRSSLPELPAAKQRRFQDQYGLNAYDAGILTVEPAVADFYESAVHSAAHASPKTLANWITGDLFGLLNQKGLPLEEALISSQNVAELADVVADGVINQGTGKTVLAEMLETGRRASQIINDRGLRQLSDSDAISSLVQRVLTENPDEVMAYLRGKETLARWLFGQVMRLAGGQANPRVVEQELQRQLNHLKSASS